MPLSMTLLLSFGSAVEHGWRPLRGYQDCSQGI
jgi:hypothetical protein